MSQTATDGEVEDVLKSTVNTTTFGIFTEPYKLDCDETEKGPGSDEFGSVPEMHSVELSDDAIDFYAKYPFSKQPATVISKKVLIQVMRPH